MRDLPVLDKAVHLSSANPEDFGGTVDFDHVQPLLVFAVVTHPSLQSRVLSFAPVPSLENGCLLSLPGGDLKEG